MEVTSGDPEPGFSFGLSSIAVSSVSLFSMRHTFEVSKAAPIEYSCTSDDASNII